MKIPRKLASSFLAFALCCCATVAAFYQYSPTRHLEPMPTLSFERISDTFGLSTNEAVTSTNRIQN